MVSLDEGALICDFAETYHVFDWRALPIRTAATLAIGLGPDSRIMRKLSGTQWPLNTLLLAMIADGVRIVSWQLLDQKARRGKTPPKSILEQLIDEAPEKAGGFDNVEDFRKWRASQLEG